MIVEFANSAWRKFRRAFGRDESLIFWVTLIFYLLLYFNPNNKTLVLFFFLYLLVLYILTKDFKKSLLLAYLASWPFKVGKTYEIELVSAWQLDLPWRPYGIANFIVISVQEIFIVLMLILLVRDFFLGKRKVFRFDIFSLCLFFYFASLVIASVLGSIRPEISLIHSLYLLGPLILYLFIRDLLIGKRNIIILSLAIFSSMVILETSLATLQFIKQNTIGVSIEISQEFLPLSVGIEEEAFLFRPLTTFNHANELAQFLLPYLFIFLPSLFFGLKKVPRIFLFSFVAGFWTLLLTLSRSAWLSFFVSILVFLFILERRWQLRLRLRKEVLRFLALSLPFILPVFIGYLLPRFINSFYAFEIYGGGYTRIELIKESLETIRQFPLFGVGLGMDVFYTYQQSLVRTITPTVFSYFPEAVHNGYLYLLSQVGIIAFLIFLGTCALFMKELIKAIKRENLMLGKVVLLSVLLGLITLFVNNVFQASVPNLREIVFLCIIFTNKRELRQLV